MDQRSKWRRFFCYMVIDLLDRLHETGDLKLLFNSGMISTKVINHRKIYHTYKGRLKSDRPKTRAVEDAAEVHNCSMKTVYEVIRKMES